MTFINSITRWLRAQDGTDVSYQSLGQSSNTNIVVPPTGNFWPGNPRAGYVRIKQSSAAGSNINVKISAIVATDVTGNNVANIYAGDANFSGNNQYIDSSFLFVYDWEVSNISLNVIAQNNAGTFDVEVVGLR